MIRCQADRRTNLSFHLEDVDMKKQLQGIAIILVSILFMVGFGDKAVFDWNIIFAMVGIAGLVLAFMPDKK